MSHTRNWGWAHSEQYPLQQSESIAHPKKPSGRQGNFTNTSLESTHLAPVEELSSSRQIKSPPQARIPTSTFSITSLLLVMSVSNLTHSSPLTLVKLTVLFSRIISEEAARRAVAPWMLEKAMRVTPEKAVESLNAVLKLISFLVRLETQDELLSSFFMNSVMFVILCRSNYIGPIWMKHSN